MLCVHLLHYDVILELLRGLDLHAFEHEIRLFETTLANLNLFFFCDALVQVLNECPVRPLLLEKEGDLIITATYESLWVDKVSAKERVSLVEEHLFIRFASAGLAYIDEVKFAIMSSICKESGIR
jgi:hypothetical protein